MSMRAWKVPLLAAAIGLGLSACGAPTAPVTTELRVTQSVPVTVRSTATTTRTITSTAIESSLSTVTATQTELSTQLQTVTETQQVPVTTTVTLEAAAAEEPVAETTAPAPQQFVQPPSSQSSFANCSEARAAGAAPLYVGDPGYSTSLDRDGDGVACE